MDVKNAENIVNKNDKLTYIFKKLLIIKNCLNKITKKLLKIKILDIVFHFSNILNILYIYIYLDFVI